MHFSQTTSGRRYWPKERRVLNSTECQAEHFPALSCASQNTDATPLAPNEQVLPQNTKVQAAIADFLNIPETSWKEAFQRVKEMQRCSRKTEMMKNRVLFSSCCLCFVGPSPSRFSTQFWKRWPRAHGWGTLPRIWGSVSRSCQLKNCELVQRIFSVWV